jgi:hypothetical protein
LRLLQVVGGIGGVVVVIYVIGVVIYNAHISTPLELDSVWAVLPDQGLRLCAEN